MAHSEDVKTKIEALLSQGKTVKDIMRLLNNVVGQTYIYEIRKNYIASRKYSIYKGGAECLYKEPYVGDSPVVGVIGDTHIPFTHPRYLEFVIDTFRLWGVELVVHIGDLADNHGLNFHGVDPNGMSANDEFIVAKQMLSSWYSEFPYVKWCTGNHDKLPQRRIKASGMPATMLRQNLYETPEGWEQKEYFIIDGIYYSHGMGTSGMNGHRKRAIDKGMSCVIGHNHSFGGIAHVPTPLKARWGMNAGVGIDIDAYAMEYQQDFSVRPVLGCGIVKDNVPYFIPMNMDKYSRHNI